MTFMALAPTRPVVKVGDYLTDGKRLVQVLDLAPGVIICEDVSCPCDRPADLVRIQGASSTVTAWREVLPAVDDPRED